MSAVVESSSNATRGHALAAGPATRTIVFGGADGTVTLGDFMARAWALAALLPEGRDVVNLCEDRHRFLLLFCAVALRGRATLLPPSRAPEAIAEVLQRHPDALCVAEAGTMVAGTDAWCLPEPLPALRAGGDGDARIDDTALAAIGFTSGSTGEPGAHPKQWRAFMDSTAQNVAALRDLWAPHGNVHVVATVPPQHMYGMELSVLLPLRAEVAVHAARPFFPHDILQALADAPAPRLLVTTPVHLRALVEACVADAALAVPALAGIVSATAPLPSELAAAAEARLGCEVREVFGSTETCVIASRRSARDHAWSAYPGVRLQPQPDGCLVHAPQLHEPVVLADLVELLEDGRFLLRGRNADLLEIAGKRASLADLTRRLLAIPGVEDGIVFQLDEIGANGLRRIAALAVAPSLAENTILEALRRGVDPVFLPRPLRRVAALPRNATGKLPRAALLALLRPASA
jgi:acyl-coenzyme A synthetase/AMP-(fatty) acid ligase